MAALTPIDATATAEGRETARPVDACVSVGKKGLANVTAEQIASPTTTTAAVAVTTRRAAARSRAAC